MTWLVDGQTFAKKVKNPTGHLNNNGGDSRNRVIYCPSCGSMVPNNHTGQEWPGLPAGVKFDPSDQELLEHLAAKRGLVSAKPHAFIDEFIPTLDGEDGICYTHPENLPGIKFDGGSTHFFHRPSRAYTTGTRKRRRIQLESDDGQFGVEMRWHKTGKTRPVVENGKQLGFKKIMVLYISMGKKNKPEKTNWVMHHYHLGSEEEEKEGELVVSKVFYQTQPRNSSGTHRVDELEEIETAGDPLPLSSCDAMTSSNLQGTPVTPISNLQGTPVTPIPASTMMEPVCEDTDPGTASNSRNPLVDVSDKMAGIDFSQGVITNRDTCSVLRWKNACLEQNEQPDVIQQPMHGLGKDQQISHLQLDSQILLEDLDIDVMNLLCDESLQADGISMHDSSQSFFSIAADFGLTLNEVLQEAEMSKNDAALDNVILDTPPDFLLDSLMNSQDTMDWLGKRKFFISSQISAGGGEFNCIEPSYNSQ